MKMDQADFEKVVAQTMANCQQLLITKGREYANSIDRLANFKRGAGLTGCTPLQVGMIYLSKHYDAIATFISCCAKGEENAVTSEPIESRFDDLINYCMLLKALIIEGRGNMCSKSVVSQEELEALLKEGAREITRVHLDEGQKLSACPFCGGEAQMTQEKNADRLSYTVSCTKCGVDSRSYALENPFDSIKRSIEFWNAGRSDAPQR